MFHITPDGPKECEVKPESGRTCRFAQASIHYTSEADAWTAFERNSMEQYGTLDSMRRNDDGDDMSHVAILADVDGTLTRGSFVLEHAVWLERHGVINTDGIAKKWLSTPKDEELINDLAVKYVTGTTGLTEQEIGADEFLGKYLQRQSNFHMTLSTLITARRQGASVSLISGSPQYLIDRLANRYGFSATGSKYHRDSEGRFTGRVDGMYSSKPKQEAVARVLASLPNATEVHGYGDTGSDLPLLAAANKRVLVNPTSETLGKYAAAGVEPTEYVFD